MPATACACAVLPQWCRPSHQRASGIEDRDTASTRQCSVSLSGRSSLVKVLRKCFSAVPSVTKIRRGDARVGRTLGHKREHLALSRRPARRSRSRQLSEHGQKRPGHLSRRRRP